MKYNTAFLDTYKKYVSKGWYSPLISSATLERWIENFSATYPTEAFDPQMCAHFLLNSLVFYQEQHLKAIIVSIIEKIRGQLNQSAEKELGHRLSEKDLKKMWEDYKQETCIIAAAPPDDVTDSAYQTCRVWRTIATTIESFSVSRLVEAIGNGKKHIIFVDDFVGTGSRMGDFLSKKLLDAKKCSGYETVAEVIDAYQSSIDFSIAVYALHTEGRERILKAFPSITFYFGDLYDEGYNLLSEQCVMYEVFAKSKTDLIAYLSKKQKELDANNPYALNLPIAFHYGCPNNSLSLYYKSSLNWSGLLPEGHPQKPKKEA